MPRRNVRENMTMSPNLTWHSSIFRAKHVNRILRVHESGQRRAPSSDFNTNRRSAKHIERPLLVLPNDFLVSLHALLAWQARKGFKPDPVPRPQQLLDPKARTSANGRGDVVRILGIY